MKRLPYQFGKLSSQLIYIGACSVFFFLFSIIYQPFGMWEHLQMGRDLFYANAALMMSIVAGSLFIMRSIFQLAFRGLGSNWIIYIFWCLAEMSVISYFLALFLHLRIGEGLYFEQVAVCFEYSCLILVYPYVITTAIMALVFRTEEKKVAEKPGTVRFVDSSKKLKLAIVRDAVLYIAANENYVEIHYLDEGGVKKYQLRASMRSIEPLAEKNSFYRCHRSYFVNPSHIKALRKERGDQILVELDAAGIAIPVSKKYYGELSELI